MLFHDTSRNVEQHWLGIVALGCAGIAAVILVVYLLKRPVLDLRVKLWLLLGLGVFPGIAGASSTFVGMEATTHREFCGSCHVMIPHFDDAAALDSQSLGARHSRNPYFGGKSCYVCHADYGMYGYVLTKAGGMRHVYEYYFKGYREMSLAEAKDKIHLQKPYDNLNCRQCHTSTLHDWRRVPDHESLKKELDENVVSCASAGCHGFAHPFSKTEEQKRKPKPTPGGQAAPSASAIPSASALPSAAPASSGPEPAP